MSESDLNAEGAEKELGRLQTALRTAGPLAEALREYARGESDDSEVGHLIVVVHEDVERALRNVAQARRVLSHRGQAAFREPRRGEAPPAELIDVAPEVHTAPSPEVRPEG